MASAARIALNRAAARGELSFASVDALADRFAQFAAYAKEQGIGRLERIDAGLLQSYGSALAAQVDTNERSPAYAQNLVSAVNTVMAQVTQGAWQRVSPTQDCGIAARCAIRATVPDGLARESFRTALEALAVAGLERQACVVELARELGLRSKEASLLNARAALAQLEASGKIRIVAGTKGGRARELALAQPSQRDALARAAAVQREARNLIPADASWKSWREGALRDGREALQAQGIAGYHELRAAYACERYEQLTGHAAPVSGEPIRDRELDASARQQISRELGHERIEVVAEYVGGRAR